MTSGHSCQDNPNTINEVRRILLEHIEQYDAAHGGAPVDAARTTDVQDQGSSGDSPSAADATTLSPPARP